MDIKGTQLFVKALIEEGVDTLFAYPGSAVISLFDELYGQQSIRLILPRHEQALVHEADGYARSTGRTGVCLVTSGPGATNIVTGIANANYDSVPLVCFCGQVRRDLIGNDAFQEVDIVGITRSIAKHSMMVTERDQLGRSIKEAFYIAATGKPGPVVVDLPSDMMEELGNDEYPRDVNIRSYHPCTGVHIGQIKRAAALLKRAQKPLLLAGGGIHISHAERAFTELAERSQIPVVSTIMGKGSIPTDHPLYIGNLGMHGCEAANHAVMECDVLCSIGCRFNDRITGRVEDFAPSAKIIHIDIDTASISRNVKVDVPVVADAGLAIAELLRYVREADTEDWKLQIRRRTPSHTISSADGKLVPKAIIETVNTMFPDAIIVTDVGQHQMWTAQYLQLSPSKSFLTSGGLGTMGYGLPAAVGAQIGNPGRAVLCITGDGGMQMNLQELATAVLEELPVIILILNNGYLGMGRQWQQLMYGGRYSGTDLKAGSQGSDRRESYVPDFVSLAHSYGAKGCRVTSLSQLSSALDEAARESSLPTVVECLIDPGEMVYPMVKSGCSLDQMITGPATDKEEAL